MEGSKESSLTCIPQILCISHYENILKTNQPTKKAQTNKKPTKQPQMNKQTNQKKQASTCPWLLLVVAKRLWKMKLPEISELSEIDWGLVCRPNWWLVCMPDKWSNLQKLRCFPWFCATDRYSWGLFLFCFYLVSVLASLVWSVSPSHMTSIKFSLLVLAYCTW